MGGQTLVIPDEPVYVATDAAKGETHQRMEVIPPVSLSFASDVRLFAPGSEKTVQVTISAYRPNVAGTLKTHAAQYPNRTT